MSATIVVNMTLTKSTKGTHVYANEQGKVKSLYIEKDALPKQPPKQIQLTIEYDCTLEQL